MVNLAQLVRATDCGSVGRGFETHISPYTQFRSRTCKVRLSFLEIKHIMKNLKTLIAALMMTICAFGAGARARYIFYFIGDGMGMGHVYATETYNRDVLGNSSPILMMRFPVATQVRTYSFDRSITDSAAAGTALSTGHKTRNGMVGMAPD